MLRFAAVATMVFATSANATELRWLNAWDQNFASMKEMIEPYIEEVQAASGGSITITTSGPETIPPLEQFEPVQAGAFHILYTHGAYHFGITPLATVFEALNGTPEEIRESGMIEYMDQEYQKLGMKLLFVPMTPEGWYGVILRRPPTEAGDLSGFKIRATPTYNSLIHHLGAIPVQLPPAEIYTSLDKGVVDGAAWGLVGPVNYRWYEVAKYMLRPSVGFNFNPVLMNLDAWNNLTPEEQQIFTEIGHKYEGIWYEAAGELMRQEEQALLDRGMQIVEMGAAKQEDLRQVWSDGLWQLGIESNGRAVTEEMRAVAAEKGL